MLLPALAGSTGFDVVTGVSMRHQRFVCTVAVGTAITRCPPHGPVLALLAHTVLTSDMGNVWRRSAGWDRGAVPELVESGELSGR